MGRLSTALIAAMSGVLVLSGAGVQAEQGAEAALHPVLGKKPPREVLNKDLLALPERERQAWIHGAMAMTAQVNFPDDKETGKCIMVYYFEKGNGLIAVEKWLSHYPDEPSTATLIAIARQACPNV